MQRVVYQLCHPSGRHLVLGDAKLGMDGTTTAHLVLTLVQLM